MTTDNKITEIYCLEDDFCKYFSSVIKNREIDSDNSVRRRNRKSTMSDAGYMVGAPRRCQFFGGGRLFRSLFDATHD